MAAPTKVRFSSLIVRLADAKPLIGQKQFCVDGVIDSNCFHWLELIALFTVTFSHLHYNVLERGSEAISGNFAVSAQNCLTSMFKTL